MRGITFDYSRPYSPPDPNRMDVACFIGFIHLRYPDIIPTVLKKQLKRDRLLDRIKKNSDEEAYDLLDVPVSIESWDDFQVIFNGEKRLTSTATVSSLGISNDPPLEDDDTILTIVIDKKEHHLNVIRGTTLAELANEINVASINCKASVDIINNIQHLVLKRDLPGTAGGITVFSNPDLGFPSSVNAFEQYVDCYLANTVKSFFINGGRKCYVIRMGDPLPLESTVSEKAIQLATLLWGKNSTIWSGAKKFSDLQTAYMPPMATVSDAFRNRHGAAYLHELSHVTYVSFPDLPDLLSVQPAKLQQEKITTEQEIFVECSNTSSFPRNLHSSGYSAPCCDETGFAIWSRIVRYLLDFIIRASKEMQLVASIPLPDKNLKQHFSTYIYDKCFSEKKECINLSSAFLQLTFPWLKPSQPVQLPGNIIMPEGTLLGILASQSLTRGAFKSVADTKAQNITDTFPSHFELSTVSWQPEKQISVFRRGLNSIELLSDVSTSSDIIYQPGSICRLTALIMRAARNHGLISIFEPLMPATWRDVETSMASLLTSIFMQGGFRGQNSYEAFNVECSNKTMTQNDIDNGRLIVNISFQPSVPIEKINIMLSLEEGGRMKLHGVA